jgi:CRISPR/Cas system CMR-associated protein Cmr1 (group 7 of RAMP superfamily)
MDKYCVLCNYTAPSNNALKHHNNSTKHIIKTQNKEFLKSLKHDCVCDQKFATTKDVYEHLYSCKVKNDTSNHELSMKGILLELKYG